MSEYGFLALDIDGTVVNSKKEITSVVKGEINRIQEAGVPVALVSGRPTKGIEHVAAELDFDKYESYILAFNGGKIIECSSGKVVYNQTIPLSLAKEVCKAAVEYNVPIVTYKDDEIIATEPDNKYTKIEAHLTHMSVRGVESMEEALDFAPDKFLYVDEPERIEELLPVMQKRFEDRLNIFRSEPFFMEIVPIGIDKAKSLDRLLDKLGMDSTKLVACGDGFNDVSMINFAGMGVAMANACAETKAVANYIAPSCDEDGVADAIKKFF